MKLGSRKIMGLMIAGLSLLATLSMLEAGLRFADYPQDTSPHQRLFVEYDATRGWRNTPGANDYYSPTGEYRTHLQYNARGIRGTERPYSKPPDTYRIIILGDSFTDGYSVDLEDRVSEVLEGLLDSVGFSSNPEVIALGTGGYSTDQELLWLESEGLRYQPDLVVLMFTNNDVWYNAQPRYWR
ncbi:MAG: SGNH/GDSL hydrolase family protein, partial [Anaerolineales bacterium]